MLRYDQSPARVLPRLTLIVTLAGGPLAACSAVRSEPPKVVTMDPKAGWYLGAQPDGRFEIPLVDRTRLRPELARQRVPYNGRERPGTVVVDVDRRFLYLVQNDGMAVRYGVGVGGEGFSWAGTNTISMKREWPSWNPPPRMLKRKPGLPHHLAGGPENPLGARALYLGSSLYRIHGTNEPWTIGEQASSGCIRLLNEDILDLYDRVRVGTPIIVKRTGRKVPHNERPTTELLDELTQDDNSMEAGPLAHGEGLAD